MQDFPVNNSRGIFQVKESIAGLSVFCSHVTVFYQSCL